MTDLRIKAVSVLADVSPVTVRRYAEQKLIEARRDSNGNWLFGPTAPDQVRAAKAKRIGRRRRHRFGGLFGGLFGRLLRRRGGDHPEDRKSVV